MRDSAVGDYLFDLAVKLEKEGTDWKAVRAVRACSDAIAFGLSGYVASYENSMSDVLKYYHEVPEKHRKVFVRGVAIAKSHGRPR